MHVLSLNLGAHASLLARRHASTSHGSAGTRTKWFSLLAEALKNVHACAGEEEESFYKRANAARRPDGQDGRGQKRGRDSTGGRGGRGRGGGRGGRGRGRGHKRGRH